MLIIRSEQLDILDKAALEKFRTRVASYLREQLPEWSAKFGGRELDEKIHLWQEWAAQYGVATERVTAKWCYLAVLAGDQFDTWPEIKSFLKQEEPPPSDKVDLMMLMLTTALRQSETR